MCLQLLLGDIIQELRLYDARKIKQKNMLHLRIESINARSRASQLLYFSKRGELEDSAVHVCRVDGAHRHEEHFVQITEQLVIIKRVQSHKQAVYNDINPYRLH